MLKRIFGLVIALGLTTAVQAETITFDVDQEGFVAPLPGSGDAGAVIVDDQFQSIGVLFRDMDFPAQGVWVGNPHGPFISSPNVAYSNDGAGSWDLLPRIELRFVDPSNINTPAAVTSVSGVFTDAGAGSTLTAYDIDNLVLGVATTVTGFNEMLSLSNIGPISRVEFVAQDLSALDDIVFEGHSVIMPAAPVPALSGFGLMLLLSGVLLVVSRRFFQSAEHR